MKGASDLTVDRLSLHEERRYGGCDDLFCSAWFVYMQEGREGGRGEDWFEREVDARMPKASDCPRTTSGVRVGLKE